MPRRRLFAILLATLLVQTFLPISHAAGKARPNDISARQWRGSSPSRSSLDTAGARRFPATVPAPEETLGFRPGEDRKLASWAKVVEYFQRLDAASSRVRFEELGKTTLGAPFVLATISAPENLTRLGEYKEIQRQLADPRLLGRNADRKAERLIARGKTIVLITCAIHSTEVGSYLSSMLIAHRLASSEEPEIQKILRETIVLLVPSLNPDGVDIVKNWYDRTLGTPFEGTTPPELYHKYVGHDNNRDWYAFTQVETQLTVDKIHNAWHPQIVHDIHQQGAQGSRLFLPPYMPPVEPNVPKQLVEGYTELGLFMSKNMLAKGFKGITWNSTYDAWTPARAYSHYHAGVRILSETASARLATPVTMKFEELRSREGYDPQKPSENFPEPWPGGAWGLRDITSYMTTAAFELLNHAATNRVRWLRRFYEVGREAVRPRRAGELWGYKLKVSKNIEDLLRIFDRAGVQYGWPAGQKRVAIEGSSAQLTYPGETILVPIAQPYGSFAKAMLERQHYPDLRDASGHPIPPYDVTAHTLPLLMNIEAEPIYTPFRTSFMKRVHISRAIYDCEVSGRKTIALYKSHIPSMDAGWTKWVLEQTCFEHEYEEITDQDIRRGNFEQKAPVPQHLKGIAPFKDLRYKTIIIPDQSARAIFEGHRKGTMPEEFTGGLGEEGVRALREFVERGGTLVCLNNASEFAIEHLKLPVRNVVEGLRRNQFYVPGSILRVVLDKSHPITEGMPQESIAWFEDSPVFEIASDPATLSRVKIIARYPQSGNPLLSGWLLGEEHLRGKAALVEVGLGEGRVFLFGFRPQYRAQSLATYPLLFNAISAGRK